MLGRKTGWWQLHPKILKEIRNQKVMLRRTFRFRAAQTDHEDLFGLELLSMLSNIIKFS